MWHMGARELPGQMWAPVETTMKRNGCRRTPHTSQGSGVNRPRGKRINGCSTNSGDTATNTPTGLWIAEVGMARKGSSARPKWVSGCLLCRRCQALAPSVHNVAGSIAHHGINQTLRVVARRRQAAPAIVAAAAAGCRHRRRGRRRGGRGWLARRPRRIHCRACRCCWRCGSAACRLGCHCCLLRAAGRGAVVGGVVRALGHVAVLLCGKGQETHGTRLQRSRCDMPRRQQQGHQGPEDCHLTPASAPHAPAGLPSRASRTPIPLPSTSPHIHPHTALTILWDRRLGPPLLPLPLAGGLRRQHALVGWQAGMGAHAQKPPGHHRGSAASLRRAAQADARLQARSSCLCRILSNRAWHAAPAACVTCLPTGLGSHSHSNNNSRHNNKRISTSRRSPGGPGWAWTQPFAWPQTRAGGRRGACRHRG